MNCANIERKYWLASGVIALFACLVAGGAAMAMTVTLITDINIDQATISRGYTVTSNDQNFRLGIYPEVLAEETRVVIKQYDCELFEYPENWLPASDVYEFDIFNKQAFKNEKPLKIRIKTLDQTNNLKKIFFWNGVLSEWVELPSEVGDSETMKSILHLPYAKMIVLENKNILQIGDASWYGYKGCLCAASPDYEKGTMLNVKDLDSGKEVVVKVNDYGPDRSLFPNRVVDLDKIAFQKLGKLSCGILRNVLVTKVN